ncbi:MAG TPA: hydroxymethylbilane synthase [Gemmatimonadaceae bacterium]|nr:hydroxymethylbilane synthase [Gemmatimonadaceae bacterium]
MSADRASTGDGRRRRAGRQTADGVVRVATRASELALRQARQVQSMLAARGQTAELTTFKTTGDKRLDEPLNAIGAKGLFTKELEQALLRGKVDCCVHSLKDLPTQSPDGLEIVAVLAREDPRDVLVVNHLVPVESLAELPRGSRVGTSSLRRRSQLLAMRDDLEVVELRGNVPTRLRKVEDGLVHAAVLAAAGLHRLGSAGRIAAYLDAPGWLPAAGQGAIAVQIRADDDRARALFAVLDDAETRLAVRAERAMLASLEGGCQVPIGALMIRDGATAVLHGLIADLVGKRVVRGEHRVDPADPEGSGERLAHMLRLRGGEEIIEQLREANRLPAPQPE